MSEANEVVLSVILFSLNCPESSTLEVALDHAESMPFQSQGFLKEKKNKCGDEYRRSLT